MGMWDCSGFFFCFSFREIANQPSLESFSDGISEIYAGGYFGVFFCRTEDGTDVYPAKNITIAGAFGDDRITAGSCNSSGSPVWYNLSASVQCSGEDKAVTAAVSNLMKFDFSGRIRSISSSDDASGGSPGCYNAGNMAVLRQLM